MLKIWGRRNSFNVQKVMWLVGELGLEHQRIDAGGSFGGLDRPEFLQMNPHGRVLVVDDTGQLSGNRTAFSAISVASMDGVHFGSMIRRSVRSPTAG